MIPSVDAERGGTRPAALLHPPCQGNACTSGRGFGIGRIGAVSGGGGWDECQNCQAVSIGCQARRLTFSAAQAGPDCVRVSGAPSRVPRPDDGASCRWGGPTFSRSLPGFYAAID